MLPIVSPRQAKLDTYYRQVKKNILSRQHPITGLLPASTAVNDHGNYTDAWVRDNVYSILAVWGLALAYRKLDTHTAAGFELEHSVIKLMRGLLFAMMQQSAKVEKFKQTQDPLDSLHAKYDTSTANTVVGDDEWGHLQLDATSIYLLMLAQMTTSGLEIIYTLDEVDFIQNLTYYISKAYQTPDYGIWERGNKINHGKPELNASSVGMAKAALEAINGLDLFGTRGSQASTIHIVPDEIARARITLESLLPRESRSKETDAALLSILSFPAFAVEDWDLVNKTKEKIIDRLQGTWGCKRFLRDGHQTVLEDTTRLHYEPWELQQFEHIECEWPLFFTYLLLDGLFRGDKQQIEEYSQRLERTLVNKEGEKLLPEVYYVPADKVEAERANPQSQQRLPNENVPLVWAQSLYLLGQMIRDGLIRPGDIDPLGRHLKVGRPRSSTVVQIALIAEDEDLQAELEVHGISTQTPEQVEQAQILQERELAAIYAQIGSSQALDLTGRPRTGRLRSLTTSRIFHVQGETLVFLPAFLDQQQFYLTLDYTFFIDQIRGELAYIQRHWSGLGRPLMTIFLTHTVLESGPGSEEIKPALLKLMQELKTGECNGVKVRLGRLNQLILTAGSEQFEELASLAQTDVALRNIRVQPSYLLFLPDHSGILNPTDEFSLECETNLELLLDSLRHSDNIYEQIELLQALLRLRGLDFDTGFGQEEETVTVRDLLSEVYTKAGAQVMIGDSLWAVVRYSAGLLDKIDIGLADSVTDILVRGKQLTVGKSYSAASLIDQPMSNGEIYKKICEFCREDIRDRVLTQEIIIYLGLLIRAEPQLLDGLLTLRVGYLILLLTSELAKELAVTQDEAYEHLMQLPPHEVKERLRELFVVGVASMNHLLFQQELMHISRSGKEIDWVVKATGSQGSELTEEIESWYRKRELEGTLNRVPQDFFQRVWLLMKHCRGLVIGDKLERRNRLESRLIVSEMTPGEKNFALCIEHLLNKMAAPQYRQVNIEALMELSYLVESNPELVIEDYIVLDVLIGHAVRLAWLERFPEQAENYDEYKSAAWQAFYDTSPEECATFIVKAFQFLTEFEQEREEEEVLA